ncbi:MULTISPECIES: tail virion protein G7P-2 [Halomonadaceae]|nr:tail virion protein G7P-2 [Halomonas axialensis]MCD2088268.1 tail virion protein G7P-2 [Halomonas meridiana]
MDTSTPEGLWLLVYCVGLVLAFGIGAINGGQR